MRPRFRAATRGRRVRLWFVGERRCRKAGGLGGVSRARDTDRRIPGARRRNDDPARRGRRTYPDGIGRLYYGGQRIVFDYHFLNTSKDSIEARSAFNLHLTDEAHVQHLAGGIGFYNWTIDTPPGKQGAFTAECHFGSDVMTGGLTRHTHRWGTDYSVWYSGGPNDGEHLWTSHDWENDTSFPFDPPVAMNAGEGFKFECDYTNTEDYDLRFGTKASDEMCILFGLVWDPNAFAAPSEGCDVTWVDSNGVGHPATDDGGFPTPPAADASLCLAAATPSGGTADVCLTCKCDSCATVLIKCKTDAECGPIIDCYQHGSGMCEPVIDAHSSGVGLAKQVSACIGSKCASACPRGPSAADAGTP